MFIAHLPAGYIAIRLLFRSTQEQRGLLCTALLGSVIPDIDLLWFYLVDQRQTLHHDYISHAPLFWFALGIVALASCLMCDQRRWVPHILLGVLGTQLHLLLDSVVGGIFWLRPFSDWQLNLIDVPARYDWWVWNFVLHWTFLIELTICAVAVGVVIRQRQTGVMLNNDKRAEGL